MPRSREGGVETRSPIEYLIGLLIALAVAAFAVTTGFICDRSFSAVVALIVAHYYVLFAAIGASGRIVAIETAVACVFILVAVLGYKTSLWWVTAAIAGHGVFDFFHHLWIDNPGVPRWWPGFCLAFDVAFGAWLAGRQLTTDRERPAKA